MHTARRFWKTASGPATFGHHGSVASLLTIDGSMGEGGGQVLRSSLSLSLVTRRPFRIERIRAGRRKPGLLRQHLTAVLAAAEVGRAEVEGAEIGSQSLSFHPASIEAGDYRFAIGTAGSVTLVLQTVLPALVLGSGRSSVTLEGGTHNPFAPPFDFLERCYLPLLARTGPRVGVVLERPGFYPAGGGLLRVSIDPATSPLGELSLVRRGGLVRRLATALVTRLPRSIGEREIETVRAELGWSPSETRVVEAASSAGPGNALLLEVEHEELTEVFTAFGSRGVPAEAVARQAARECRRYLASEAAAGERLADQLLLPMAIGAGGSFRAVELSRHATTNVEVIRAFLDVDVRTERLGDDLWDVVVRGAKIAPFTGGSPSG